MKVLIVSDSHRHDENLDKVIEKEQPIDMLIHCGDVEGSEMHISEKCQCPVYMVRGCKNKHRTGKLPQPL